MKRIAIIPARGGSKRIPKKNTKEFLGLPIIAYSIKAALNTGLFDEVMVSTDEPEIAEIARQFGAKVPFLRSSKNASDVATTLDVLHEVCANYQRQGQSFDVGCCIYPTAPLLQPDHLKKGLDKLIHGSFDTVFSSVAFSFPVWRGFEIDTTERIVMLWPENKNTRSQDLKKVYHDAGQWYWFKTDKLKNGLINENTGTVILSEGEVQDIDEPSDWKMAELKYKALYG